MLSAGMCCLTQEKGFSHKNRFQDTRLANHVSMGSIDDESQWAKLIRSAAANLRICWSCQAGRPGQLHACSYQPTSVLAGFTEGARAGHEFGAARGVLQTLVALYEGPTETKEKVCS